ncbi:MAG TPA: 5'-nucleotidase C-terminal domain-containing protein [Nitrospirales bacterium]|jgi:5'-nucleotidase|nr:5'-nucleotidase C-terminal domain-containing protein [Nitrospirales bacterium]
MRRLIIALVVCFLVLPAHTTSAQTALTILYTSEHHGTIQPIDQGPHVGEGGVERRAALILQVRKESDHVLVVDSGDLLMGTAMSSVYRGEADIAAMNLMRYDAVAVGNHDFDFGARHLSHLQKAAVFPFLCTNVRPREPDVCKPYVVKTLGTIRIGLIGLVGKRNYPDTFNRSVVQEVTFQDPIAAAKKAAEELRERVELLVAITHQDTEEDLALAKAVPALDVIIGGHTEGFDGLVPQGATGPVEGRVELVGTGAVFVKTHRQGRTLGRLDLLFHEKTIMIAEARNLPVTPTVPSNTDMAKLVQDYARKLDEQTSQVIGEAAHRLAGENEEVRTRETTLGNLLADLARRHAGTEIALVNAGMVRSSIPAGPVTLKRVMEVLPFDSTVTTFSITGAQLQAALEHSVSRLPQSSGRFLQVSGLAMTFDPAAASGNRIRTIRVNDTPLDLSRRYSVASVAFIAEGGDGYSMFLHATDKRDHQVPIRDLLISALKSGSLTAKEEGRIVRQ